MNGIEKLEAERRELEAKRAALYADIRRMMALITQDLVDRGYIGAAFTFQGSEWRVGDTSSLPQNNAFQHVRGVGPADSIADHSRFVRALEALLRGDVTDWNPIPKPKSGEKAGDVPVDRRPAPAVLHRLWAALCWPWAALRRLFLGRSI